MLFNVTIYLHKQNLLFHNLIYTGNMPVTSSDVLLKEIASWHNRINWQQKCLKRRQKILYATKVKKISMHSFCDYTVSETRDCPQSNLLCLQGCSKKSTPKFSGNFQRASNSCIQKTTKSNVTFTRNRYPNKLKLENVPKMEPQTPVSNCFKHGIDCYLYKVSVNVYRREESCS